MLKKIISLFLALSLVLGICLMAPTASAESADENYESYTMAVDVLSAIGILNGYEPENGSDTDSINPPSSISREEMAKMIAFLSNSGSDVSSLYASAASFSDVSGTDWTASYIAYCVSNGIIAGRSAETFDPHGKVTPIETAKMLLVVLGFNADAQNYVGPNWKMNVLRDAESIGLFDSINHDYDTESPITREEAAQMMYNALNARTVDLGIPLVQFIFGVESTDKLTAAVLPYNKLDAARDAMAIIVGTYTDSEDLMSLFAEHGEAFTDLKTDEERAAAGFSLATGVIEPVSETVYGADQQISTFNYVQTVLNAITTATKTPDATVTEPSIFFTNDTITASLPSEVLTETMSQDPNANTAMEKLLDDDAMAVANALGTSELLNTVAGIREKNLAERAARTPVAFSGWSWVADRNQAEDQAALYTAISNGLLDVYDAPENSVAAQPAAPMTLGEIAKFLTYLVLGQEEADALANTEIAAADYQSHPYAPYVWWAENNDYLNTSIKSNEINPDDVQTVMQFAATLLRALGYSDSEITEQTANFALYLLSAAEGRTASPYTPEWEPDDEADGLNIYALLTRDMAARLLIAALNCEMQDGSGKTLGEAYNYEYTAPPTTTVTVTVDTTGEVTVSDVADPTTDTTETVIPAGSTVTVTVEAKGEVTVSDDAVPITGTSDELDGEPVETFTVKVDQSVTVETLGHIVTQILKESTNEAVFDIYDQNTWGNVESYTFTVSESTDSSNTFSSSSVTYVPTGDGNYRVITEQSEEFTDGFKENVENRDYEKDNGLADFAHDLRDTTGENNLLTYSEEDGELDVHSGEYVLIAPGDIWGEDEEYEDTSTEGTPAPSSDETSNPESEATTDSSAPEESTGTE